MSKTVFTGAHVHLVDALVKARKRSRLTQAQLGARIGKTQGFISLIERSQRRVDVLEFYAICRALGVSPVKMFAAIARQLPETLDI